MRRVVVLLGPPGSGKTTIAEALAGRGWRWRDWEQIILDRWGSREEFVRHKASALSALHEEIRAWIASDPTPALVETTGLSDAPLIDELDGAGVAFVVRLEVPEDEAIRRVVEREEGRHLTDDPEVNRSVWRAVEASAPHRRTDLTIDTTATSPTSAADVIVRMVAAS